MYAVKLQTFEGPLDVLLELIEKEKMDISDISLTRVTGQFLEYIRSVQEKDPHHISDFLVVAAKLVLIKSKTLLPFLEVSAEEEAEMTDLKEKLESYKKIKEGARQIALLERKLHIAYHRASGLRDVVVFMPPAGVTAEALRELLAQLEAARAADSQTPKLEEQKITAVISFEEKLQEIKKRLEHGIEERFRALADPESKMHMIVAFLAVLELVRQNVVFAKQSAAYGEILLIKT